MTDRPILRVIEGAPAEAVRHVTPWRCQVCLEAGRESGPLIEIVLEAYVRDGLVTPGEKAMACMACYARGKLTIV